MKETYDMLYDSSILSSTFNFPSMSVPFMYCKIWSPTFINVPRKMTQNKNYLQTIRKVISHRN